MLTNRNIRIAILVYIVVQLAFMSFKIDIDFTVLANAITVAVDNGVSWWFVFTPTFIVGVVTTVIGGMLSNLKM